MNELKPGEESIEQEPEFLPSGNDDKEEQTEIASSLSEEMVDASAEQWQEAVDAFAEDEREAQPQTMEDWAVSEPPIDDSAADAEETGTEKIRIIASDETISLAAEDREVSPAESAEPEDVITATHDELKPVIEAILFVADEPLPFKQLCKVLGDVNEEDVKTALDELVAEYDAR